MSGGRSDFVYTTDAGVLYALNQDTSNANVAGNIPSANGTDYLSRDIKPRFAVYGDAPGLRRRKVYVGAFAALATLPTTFTAGDESGPVLFTLLYTRGEKARRSRSINTGIIP
jgi:hypothetical protein